MNSSFLPFTTQMSMNDKLFSIPITIYIKYLIYVLLIIFIIDIILFSLNKHSIASILDSEEDFLRRQRPHYLNICYRSFPFAITQENSALINKLFIRDIYDSTGANLIILLGDRNLQPYTLNGHFGYILGTRGNRFKYDLAGNPQARVPVVPASLEAVQSRGIVVSSGTPDAPVVVDDTLSGGKTLLINERV